MGGEKGAYGANSGSPGMRGRMPSDPSEFWSKNKFWELFNVRNQDYFVHMGLLIVRSFFLIILLF